MHIFSGCLSQEALYVEEASRSGLPTTLYVTLQVPAGTHASLHSLHVTFVNLCSLADLYVPFQVSASGSTTPVSWRERLDRKPAARASILTGLYITIVGLALCSAPHKVFGLLFDVRQAGPFHLMQ